MPSSITKEREAKRKASEANIEISGLEEDINASKDPEKKRMGRVMQKMEETMTTVSYRTKDVSSMEQKKASMSC